MAADGDSLRRVRAGERAQIPADAYNAFLDGVRARRAAAFDGGAPAVRLPPHDPAVALVRNATGGALDRFAVVGLGAPLVGPGDDFAEFARKVNFDGSAPDGVGPVAVLLEPLAAGAVGRAVVSGLTPVLVWLADPAHCAAAPAEGVTGYLVSADEGPAHLLWVDAAAGSGGSGGAAGWCWAYVDLRNGCTPGGAAGSGGSGSGGSGGSGDGSGDGSGGSGGSGSGGGGGCVVTFVTRVCPVWASGGGSGEGSGSGDAGSGGRTLAGIEVEYAEYDFAACEVVRRWCEVNPEDCCAAGSAGSGSGGDGGSGGSGGSGDGPPVETPCCPDYPVARSLSITFASGTGPYAGLNGNSYPLTYDELEGKWTNLDVLLTGACDAFPECSELGGNVGTMRFWCDGSDWKLEMSGCASWTSTAAAETCGVPAFEVTGTGTGQTTCTYSVDWTITE